MHRSLIFCPILWKLSDMFENSAGVYASFAPSQKQKHSMNLTRFERVTLWMFVLFCLCQLFFDHRPAVVPHDLSI